MIEFIQCLNEEFFRNVFDDSLPRRKKWRADMVKGTMFRLNKNIFMNIFILFKYIGKDRKKYAYILRVEKFSA